VLWPNLIAGREGHTKTWPPRADHENSEQSPLGRGAEPSRRTGPAGRIRELDALRGFAAFAVMLFHYTSRYGQLYGYNDLLPFHVSWGQHGVQLFFLISGFVIFMTLERTRQPMDFVVSRFSRLYPTYWAGVIATFTIVAVMGLPGRETSFTEFLVNLTMLQRLIPGIHDVDGVYWTLAVEMTFYALIFGLYLLRRLPQVEWFGMAWLALAVAVRTTPLADTLAGKALTLALIMHHCGYFIAGIMFYRFFANQHGPLAVWLIVACFLFQPVLDPSAGAAVPFVCAAIFGLFIWNRLGFLGHQPFIFLGSISYALYIVHQNIGYVVMRWAQDQGLPPLAAILVAIAITISLAAAITWGVEKPSLRSIRSRYKAYQLRSA
jgi:peptidoglycan/LPS O-acetylase OafA/YrhL